MGLVLLSLVLAESTILGVVAIPVSPPAGVVLWALEFAY